MIVTSIGSSVLSIALADIAPPKDKPIVSVTNVAALLDRFIKGDRERDPNFLPTIATLRNFKLLPSKLVMVFVNTRLQAVP
jgi:hypothetical protein